MKKSASEDQFHKSLIDNLYDGVYFVDENRLITYWNKGAERITGYCSQDVLGKFCHANILDHITDEGHHLCMEGCPLMETIRDGEPREAQVHLRHADGYRVPVLVRTTPMYDDQKKIIGAVEVFSNNQSLLIMKERVNELEKDVFRDALTGVGNRKLLEIKINTALLEYSHQHIPFGLLFIDVDRFKAVNDAYGHHAGDHVLENVAANLTGHLRGTDICGRWGGEEFVVLLQNVNLNSLSQIAEKLRAMIESSFILVDGQRISVTVSIGAALVHENDTLESLIERTDHLMYQSKQGGRNRVTRES
ncbi:MAG: sensor domain-containing diguanylate cyclase [Anaerolineales bacterium]|nr:sensor domain-containing diguanylate cyclase [Anaerolineales bacterium]